MNLTAQASRSFWNKPGIKFVAFAVLVWALVACALVPQKFEDPVAISWAHLGVGVGELKTACGLPHDEARAKAVLLGIVEFVVTYTGYYGNEFDRKQALAMKRAILGCDPGGGVKFCEEYSEQLRRRVEQVAAVINGRPRR